MENQEVFWYLRNTIHAYKVVLDILDNEVLWHFAYCTIQNSLFYKDIKLGTFATTVTSLGRAANYLMTLALLT